jgi:two-component system, response regulator
MIEKLVEILLVEDNPSDVELTLHALKRCCPANQIQVARDGVEALDFIFCRGLFANRSPEIQPRIILLDLKLPRMTGVEVLQHLKNDPHTKSIPVIVLTSSSDHSDVNECYQIGANSYIVKPVNFEDFLEATRTLGTYWLEINHTLGKHP